MSLLSSLADIVSALSLTISILIITYITFSCFAPPTPNPDNLSEANRDSFANRLLVYYSCGALVLLTSIYHALLCLAYPAPPTILCPRPANLSPKLFTWNPHTILCVALILMSGQILLLSFNKLGTTSNFQLAVPKKLVTTGVYSWIQHPSYTATLVIFLANGALFQRRDGGAACWLPGSIVGGGKFDMVFQIGYLLTVVAGCWALATRVRNEESMLRRTFGTEWEEYHRRTKRFLPGVI